MAAATSKASSLTARNEELHGALETQIAEIRNLQDEIRDLRKELEETKDNLKISSETCGEWRRRYEAAQQELDPTRNQLDAARKDIEDLKERLNSRTSAMGEIMRIAGENLSRHP